ncbi:phage tail protein [Clostridium botulinum]|uniref:phage tail protein n=1 Tax=Clostridium botulinum TaxID=1491 RepID=UPI0021BFA6F1|nr:phage tail protein [Clostridium botulinum]WCJ72076.1 phage tail protein [Clostridium botulinum]WCJ75915.1 phage tail protein [Clostridium botulinum]WCJ79754.1 phage tail protein [Clostridium botulinum]
MVEQFYTILTKIGKAKIANSTALGTKVNFCKLQVGDSNGTYYNPTEDQTELKHKVWEGNINSISIDENNPNWIIIEVLLPSNVGGFMIREAAILDDEDNVIAIAKYPETYKPLTQDGSSKDILIRTILEVSNTSSVTLKVDPTVILATKKDIEIITSSMDDLGKRITKNEESITNIKSDLADITTYQTAGGTANAISLNLSTLVNGYATTFIVNKNNNKNATTINGKQLYKPNTTTAPNLVTGKAVSVWYDATKDCFFIKASAEGNAVAKDVLAGKIFSNDDDTGLVGTLDLSNLTSNNIKEGITINGVKGNVKPMKYGIILNLTTKIGYQTSSGYSIPGGGYVLTGRTGPSYYIKCNGIEYYYDYNKSKPNYFPVPFNTGRILYYKGEHRYSTKLSSILKISTSRSNGYDYDVISSFDIAPAGYMPYQMLLVNNNWIILFTKESECIISTYDLNLSTKIKEISLNLDNPCLSYNHIFDIGNSTKIYDYTGKLIKSVEVMKPYDKLVDLNKNAAIGENEYDLGVVLHTEGSDCMCGNIVSPLL